MFLLTTWYLIVPFNCVSVAPEKMINRYLTRNEVSGMFTTTAIIISSQVSLSKKKSLFKKTLKKRENPAVNSFEFIIALIALGYRVVFDLLS